MSLPWLKLYGALPRHTKALRLDAILRRRRTWTHVVELWMWASEERPDGNLSGLEPVVIARQAGYRGDSGRFVDALREVGFLDADGRPHGWRETVGVDEAPRTRPPEWSRAAYPAVYARDGYACRYCGTGAGPFAIDHIHPRSQGGGDEAENLAVACRSCNSSKGARTPEQARMALLPIPTPTVRA
jgi:hypothetical protein